jgi:hypothetical protein
MAKASKKAAKKPSNKRSNKYEEKLKINGTFEQLLHALANPKNTLKKK